MIEKQSENRFRKSQDIVFAILIMLGFLFLLWKAQFGYFFHDEPFMISTGHRLLHGDHLIIDEWNLAQNIGIIFLPFIWVFTTVTHSTEGLLIFCRIVYVVWWIAVSVILYRRLRNYGWISIAAVFMFVLFTPLDEMTLTYNVVALSCLALFSSYFLTKGSKALDYLNGLVLTVAVLVYPYLVMLYAVYAVAVLMMNYSPLKKWWHNESRLFDLKLFLRMTAVAFALFVCYLLYLCSCGIEKLFENVGLILQFMEQGSGNMIEAILNSELRLQFIGGNIIILISMLDRNRQKHKLLYLIPQAALWGIQMTKIFFVSFFGHFNMIMFPITILGLQAYVLTSQKDHSLALSMGLTGILFSYLSSISSDTGILAITSGIVPASLASCILLAQLCSEYRSEKTSQWLRALVLVGMVMAVFGQIGSQTMIRYERNYWDELTQDLNTRISVGAAKGIITTEQYAEYYEQQYKNALAIKKNIGEDGKLLVVSQEPIMYLDADVNYATNSSWVWYQNNCNFQVQNEKMNAYLSSHSNKTPDCIYILEDDFEYIDALTFIDIDAYDMVELPFGQAYYREMPIEKQQ